MAFSLKDPHFLLKIITLILLLLTIFTTLQPSGSWGHSFIVEGLTNTSAIVILVLIISLVALESPKKTEMCLILAVLGMLIICCGLWATGGERAYVAHDNGYYVVFTKETDRRNAYLGLTIPGVIFEVIDVILHVLDKNEETAKIVPHLFLELFQLKKIDGRQDKIEKFYTIKYARQTEIRHMVAKFLRLVKNYGFLFKLIELLLAFVCLGILIHDETYSVPRWLWLIYCTNSLTYIVILSTITGNYILEEDCEYLDLVFSAIGVPLYLIGGIAAIVRIAIYIPEDASNDSCELALGIIFVVNASLMLSQVIWTSYARQRRFSRQERLTHIAG